MSTLRLGVWPTLPPAAYLRRATTWRPFPLDQSGCRLYPLARHALWNGCRALGLGAGDTVLVPAYHHGSEVEALLRTGVRVRYYEITAALEPDAAGLQALLGPEVRALFLIHYLGFPQDAARWRRWCDERGLLLIEDAAQAFLATHDGRPVGSYGDLAIFCLYKTYGVPDGGAAVSAATAAEPSAATRTGAWRAAKRHAAWAAERSGSFGGVHLRLGIHVDAWRDRTAGPNAEFALGDPTAPPSVLTRRLLPKLLTPATAERRREHYRFLLEHLGDRVPAPFRTLPAGASPFAFLVEVPDATTSWQHLRHRGVVGIRFWLHPHPSLPVPHFPRTAALRGRILALPVHQELGPAALRQIVNAVRDVCIA